MVYAVFRQLARIAVCFRECDTRTRFWTMLIALGLAEGASAQIVYPALAPAGVPADQFSMRGFGSLAGPVTPWDSGSVCGQGYVRGERSTCVPDPEREQMSLGCSWGNGT